MSRELIEKIALTWIGTPYHHHSGIKGVGCDCVHLLIKVYVEAGLMEDYDPGYYPPQFFMHSDEERFLKKVLGYSREIPEGLKSGSMKKWENRSRIERNPSVWEANM